MDTRRFERLQQLFSQACDLPPRKQARFLEDLSPEDWDLRPTLEKMLGAESKTLDPVSNLQDQLGDITSDALSRFPGNPETIADFKILGHLGSGGMGTVFRAEQKSPKRIVALKVVRADSLNEASRRRFALESEVLGRLHHPCIAQIFESGIASIEGPGGTHDQSYFAMEFVDGEDLLDYARVRSRKEQVELVIRILDAVHHAHQRGVIHRDLKPANILVMEDGNPKVLDFGIARLLDEHPEEEGLTQAGQFIGTVPYVSPEQMNGSGDDIDIRSDVYSIGVILYEILAGRKPWKTEGKTLLESLRILNEEDAPFLGSLSKDLKGDLEVICHKALEKNPDRRYASAHEFAADLRRYLRHEPIEARPPSAVYAFSKFTRRHRGIVFGSAIAVLIGIVALVFLSQFAAREASAKKDAEQARDMALENLRIANSVNRFLDEILKASNPLSDDLPGSMDVTLLDALRRAEESFEELEDQPPVVEGFIRSSIGSTFSVIGQYDDARRHLEKAYPLIDAHTDRLDTRRLNCLNDLAELELRCGFPEKAEPLALESWQGYVEREGASSPGALNTVMTYLRVLRDTGRVKQALELAEKTYFETKEAHGEESTKTLIARHNYAILLYNLGQFEESEEHAKEVVEAQARILGPEHSRTINSIDLLSNVYWRQGRLEEAETLCRKVLESRQAVLGQGHVSTLRAMHNLAILLGDQGHYREAETFRREQLQKCRDALGEQHPVTRQAVSSLSILLRNTGKFEESESLLRPLAELERRLGAANLPDTLNALGTVLLDLERPAEALEAFEEVMEWVEGTELSSHWRSIIFRANYGNALRAAGFLEDAEIEILDAYSAIRDTLGETHSETGYVAYLLAQLREAQGRPDEAEVIRRRHGVKY